MSAERMRRCRERQRAGRIVVPVELDEAAIDDLVSAHLLEPLQVDDRHAIARALERVMRLLRVTPSS